MRSCTVRCVSQGEREVGEREKERRCLGRGESRFGVKSSSVGNYQSLRNVATALTRQAAAWLQQLRKHANLLYPVHRSLRVYNLSDFWHTGFWLIIGLHCYCCLFLSLLSLTWSFFVKLGPFCSVKRDHIMLVRDCLAVQVFWRRVVILICCHQAAGMYPPSAHPLWIGETTCFKMGNLSLIKPTKALVELTDFHRLRTSQSLCVGGLIVCHSPFLVHWLFAHECVELHSSDKVAAEQWQWSPLFVNAQKR